MEFLIVLGAGVILLGLACIIVIIRIKRGGQGIQNWPKVPGKVVEAFVYTHERKTTDVTTVTHTPVIKFSYSVDGTTYTSTKLDAAPSETHSYLDRAKADTWVAAYPVGRAVAVHYNSQNPKQAVLMTQKPIAHNAVLWYGIVNFFLGIGAIALAFVIA